MNLNCNCGSSAGEIGVDTTARVVITLPEGMALTDYSEIRLTATQGGTIVFQKHRADLTELSAQNRTYFYRIDRDDTADLDAYIPVQMQIWWASGESAGSTAKKEFTVRELLGGVDDE